MRSKVWAQPIAWSKPASHSRNLDLSDSDETAQYVLDVAAHVGAWIASIVVAWLVEDIGQPCQCPTWHGKTVHVCNGIVTGEA